MRVMKRRRTRRGESKYLLVDGRMEDII